MKKIKKSDILSIVLLLYIAIIIYFIYTTFIINQINYQIQALSINNYTPNITPLPTIGV